MKSVLTAFAAILLFASCQKDLSVNEDAIIGWDVLIFVAIVLTVNSLSLTPLHLNLSLTR